MAPLREDDAASSSSISSPPSAPLSPQTHAHGFADTIHVAAHRHPDPGFGGGVAAPDASHAIAAPLPQNGNASSTVDEQQPKPAKKPRKPREVKSTAGKDGKAPGEEKPKERKPRKPREPKVKTEGVSASRKKRAVEEKAVDAPAGARQSTLTDMVTHFNTPTQLTHGPSQPHPPLPHPQQQQHLQPQQSNPDTISRSSLPPPPASAPPTPRPFSSGQNYDPIRGMIDSAPHRPSSTVNGTHSAAQLPQSVVHPSASPSIRSLIDPPVPAQAALSQTPQATPPSLPRQTAPPSFASSQQPSPQPQPPHPASFTLPSAPSQSRTETKPRDLALSMDGAMDVDVICEKPNASVEIKASKSSSSAAPTPKAAKPTPPPAPKGTGSGLLSSSDLFGGPSSNDAEERKGVDIDIVISLNPNGGNTINIAQEIFKKYGRDAINPRAAAHRERLLQIQAAASRIDGGSADDMSVDLMSELDVDSNIDMGGMDDDNTAEEGRKPVKRRKKAEEYDKEDDFIDDTELAWQEQAAVAKDGFFVYSGPLVPEGQNAQVENAAGTTTKSTRGGRGRGRGSRGGSTASTRGASTAAAQATLAKKDDPNAPPSTTTTRGRGRGRGTGVARKPRITKADRERKEMLEKLELERQAAVNAAAVASNGSLSGGVAVTTTTTSTTTPASHHSVPSTGLPPTAPHLGLGGSPPHHLGPPRQMHPSTSSTPAPGSYIHPPQPPVPAFNLPT